MISRNLSTNCASFIDRKMLTYLHKNNGSDTTLRVVNSPPNRGDSPRGDFQPGLPNRPMAVEKAEHIRKSCCIYCVVACFYVTVIFTIKSSSSRQCSICFTYESLGERKSSKEASSGDTKRRHFLFAEDRRWLQLRDCKQANSSRLRGHEAGRLSWVHFCLMFSEPKV